MRFVSKLGTVIAATAVLIGALAISAPAQADTSWGCGGYCRIGGR
ncbi:MAG: hypothetical protein JWM79_1722 [Nocardioides sp.]|jgi:hypothetical protein|nr:hypothetical protein [Nocardioides sp.]